MKKLGKKGDKTIGEAGFAVIAAANEETLPFCCGVQVIGEFSTGEDLVDVETQYDSDGNEVETREYECGTKADAENNIQEGLTLATTTPNQTDAIAGLEALGFEAITEFTNRKTNKVVTLWGRVNVKARSRRRS